MRDDALALQVDGRIYLIRSGKALLTNLETQYNAQAKIVFDTIRELMTISEKPKPRIGFYS